MEMLERKLFPGRESYGASAPAPFVDCEGEFCASDLALSAWRQLQQLRYSVLSHKAVLQNLLIGQDLLTQ